MLKTKLHFFDGLLNLWENDANSKMRDRLVTVFLLGKCWWKSAAAFTLIHTDPSTEATKLLPASLSQQMFSARKSPRFSKLPMKQQIMSTTFYKRNRRALLECLTVRHEGFQRNSCYKLEKENLTRHNQNNFDSRYSGLHLDTGTLTSTIYIFSKIWDY